MKKLLSFPIFLTSIFLTSYLPKFVIYAQTGETVDIGSQVQGFFGFKCIMDFVFRMVDIAIIGSGILLLGFLIWGGMEWLVSGGDKGKAESARNRLTNALIGVAITAAAFAVWKAALTFLGIDLSNICSTTPFK